VEIKGEQRGKRVLMICYHFPPIINGGVERSIKFAHYLPDFGYEPVVLTTNRFGTEMVEGIEVVRTGEFMRRAKKFNVSGAVEVDTGHMEDRREISQPGGKFAATFKKFLSRWVVIPDDQIRWVLCSLFTAVRIAMKRKVKIIYSSSPPASSHILAYLVKLFTRTKWVMDLRDPWTLEPLNRELVQSRLRMVIDRFLERLCISLSDAVICNTEESLEAYVSMYPSSRGKFMVIPNGFDEGEMKRAKEEENEESLIKESKSYFIISHVGSFNRYRDRPSVPVDFLRAVWNLVGSGAIDGKKIRVIFVGALSEEEKTEVNSFGLGECIQLMGQLSHHEALRIMVTSSVLLLYDPGREARYYIHGKLYEYLGAEKPILAIVPDGASSRLATNSGMALICRPGDVDCIEEAIMSLYRAEWMPECRVEVERFHRRYLTSLLADCFDRVSSGVGL